MPDLTFEAAHHFKGITRIAGIDEAGRGPLAGPVLAAAVILPPIFTCDWLDDSKRLNARQRDAAYQLLCENPLIEYAIGWADVAEIEQFNILRASHLAMERAAAGLKSPPDLCLIDGLPVRNFPYPQEAIVKGDGKSLSIAAASVLAKVTRDRHMKRLDEKYPEYGFAQHQGYGTKRHLEALRIHGPCAEHRRTFQPVAQLRLPFD